MRTKCSTIQESSDNYFLSRRYRGWDFNPQAGLGTLVLAGGLNPSSWSIEISQNGGGTFRQVADLPYANNKKLYGSCVVVIDHETVFVAGGIRSKG